MTSSSKGSSMAGMTVPTAPSPPLKRVPVCSAVFGRPRTFKCVVMFLGILAMFAAGIPLLALGALGLSSGTGDVVRFFRLPLCRESLSSAVLEPPPANGTASPSVANLLGGPTAMRTYRIGMPETPGDGRLAGPCPADVAAPWVPVDASLLEAGARYQPSILVTHGSDATLSLRLDLDTWTSSLFVNVPLSTFNLTSAIAVPGHSTLNTVVDLTNGASGGTFINPDNGSLSCSDVVIGGCPFVPVQSLSEYTVPADLSSPFALNRLPESEAGLRLRLMGQVRSDGPLSPVLILRWSATGLSDNGLRDLMFLFAGILLIDVAPAFLFFFVQNRRALIGAAAQTKIEDVLQVLSADERAALDL